MSNDNPCPDGMIRIQAERGGESMSVDVPQGATVQFLVENDSLRGVDVATTRVNGAPATGETSLEDGDTVTQIPKSGKQGN